MPEFTLGYATGGKAARLDAFTRRWAGAGVVLAAKSAATEEEVAARLSLEEGREVSAQEIREIVARGLRKLRVELGRRGIRGAGDLVPDR